MLEPEPEVPLAELPDPEVPEPEVPVPVLPLVPLVPLLPECPPVAPAAVPICMNSVRLRDPLLSASRRANSFSGSFSVALVAELPAVEVPLVEPVVPLVPEVPPLVVPAVEPAALPVEPLVPSPAEPVVLPVAPVVPVPLEPEPMTVAMRRNSSRVTLSSRSLSSWRNSPSGFCRLAAPVMPP